MVIILANEIISVCMLCIVYNLRLLEVPILLKHPVYNSACEIFKQHNLSCGGLLGLNLTTPIAV